MINRRDLVAVFQTAAVTLAVVLFAAVAIGPRVLPAAGPGASGSGNDGTPTGTPQGSRTAPAASVSPSRATQRISVSDLGFDVPAGWTSRVFNLPLLNHGLEPVLTVGTGSLSERCVNATGQQALTGKKDATCTASWSLPAGGVQLRLIFDSRQGTFQGCCQGIYSSMTEPTEAPPAGSEPVTIGGLQARVTRPQWNKDPLTGETITNADEVIDYRLVAPAWPFYGYVVTAALRGPNLPKLEAQVSAVMASLAYTPAIAPMPAGRASLKAALHSTLALINNVNQCAGCDTRAEGFTDTPGETNTATITRIAFDSNRTLLRPLKVRCTATIRTTGVDYWLVKLTYEWDATGKYPAGAATATYMVPRDMSFPLSVAPQAAPTNEDAMPYISPRHPYNPG
jgi:hypothetical protein